MTPPRPMMTTLVRLSRVYSRFCPCCLVYPNTFSQSTFCNRRALDFFRVFCFLFMVARSSFWLQRGFSDNALVFENAAHSRRSSEICENTKDPLQKARACPKGVHSHCIECTQFLPPRYLPPTAQWKSYIIVEINKHRESFFVQKKMQIQTKT